MHVLIIGAGPGGLTVAQCLRKQGISFEIFDRDENEDARFQGWAIGLHTIIDDMISAFPADMSDLKESTNHLAPLTIPAQVAVHFNGTPGRVGFEDSSEKPFIRSERYRLRKWLSTNIRIQWGKHATKFHHNSAGVRIEFLDGTSATGDILIGSDGVNSHVREYLLQRPNSELLKPVPTSAIVGQVKLSGEVFRRHLQLGHSGWNVMNSKRNFVSFNGLHDVFPDGKSGRFFWIFMEPDATAGSPDHWLRESSQQEKLDHVLKVTDTLSSNLREIFELTSPMGIKDDLHCFRDLELESLPACRVALVGDAAHAMSPFRGEGGYQTFIDGLKLSEHLIKLAAQEKYHDITAVENAISNYNSEMLVRGNEAVRLSRGTHKELMEKAWVVSLLLAWAPLLLTLLLRVAIKGPLKLRPLPEENITLPGDKAKRQFAFWQRVRIAVLFIIGLEELSVSKINTD